MINYKDVIAEDYFKEMRKYHNKSKNTYTNPFNLDEGIHVLVDDAKLLEYRYGHFDGTYFPNDVYDLQQYFGSMLYLDDDITVTYKLIGFVFTFEDYYLYIMDNDGKYDLIALNTKYKFI